MTAQQKRLTLKQSVGIWPSRLWPFGQILRLDTTSHNKVTPQNHLKTALILDMARFFHIQASEKEPSF